MSRTTSHTSRIDDNDDDNNDDNDDTSSDDEEANESTDRAHVIAVYQNTLHRSVSADGGNASPKLRNAVSTASIMNSDSKVPIAGMKSEAKWQPYVAALVLAASHGGFSFGFELTILNTSLSTIGGDFLWCNYEGYTGCKNFDSKSGWVQIGILLGGILGCCIGGFVTFRIGCVKTFLIGDTMTLLGVVLGAASVNFGMLLSSRLLIGVAAGIVGVVIPTYIAEVTPPHTRGSYQVVQQIVLQIGLFVGTLIGLPLSSPPGAIEGQPEPTPEQQAYSISSFDRTWWRCMLGIGGIPPAIGIVCFTLLCPHETPYYLITRERIDEAVAVLQRTKRQSQVDEYVNEIEMRVVVAREASAGGRTWWRTMASDRSAMHAFLVGSFVAAFQQFGGINAFYTSSNHLFSQAGLEPDLITIVSNVLTLVSLIVVVFSVFLVEIVGRKPLLVYGALGMALAVLPGGIMLFVDETSDASTWTAIAGAIVFVAVYSMSWGPVVWVYIFEIMPTDLRGQVGGIMAAINSASGVVMVYVANLVETRTAYVAFAAANFVGALVSAWVVKETRATIVGDSPYYVNEACSTFDSQPSDLNNRTTSDYVDVVL